MVQSPSWKANWFAASQEIPRISRNPKVHYRTYKRPPPVSILGQPNPVHIPTSHLLQIHSNIIHPSTPRSPQWSLSLRFPHQDSIHTLSTKYYYFYQIKKNEAVLQSAYGYHTTPPQPNHNVTPTHIEPEQYNPWNNSTNKSQAPEDGCINIRNMLSII